MKAPARKWVNRAGTKTTARGQTAYDRRVVGRAARLVLAVVVAVSVAVGAASVSAASGPTVAVVRCATSGFLPPGAKSKTPSRVAVLGAPSSIRGLVAYTNFEEFLVAPAGMRCSGSVGADGNGEILVWPSGYAAPSQHSRYEGLTLRLDPACASCRAADACPFFPTFAASVSFPCSATAIPHGERVYALNSAETTFEDPPGVPGDGWPSGGRDPANGVVGVNASENSSVYRATCTLPASEHSVCTVILNDVLARYGAKPPASPVPAPSPPSKGSTLYVHDFNGNKLAARASIFGDPATPATQFDRPPSGSRLVAIQLTLTGDGPGNVSSDVNIDTSLVGTNGQVYTAASEIVAGCTNFAFGSFTLAAGQSEVGCVAFAVPDGVDMKRVTFSLTDGSVDSVYWTAP